MGVAHLSDRIGGAGSFTTEWPRNITPMTRAEQREIQELLLERGFDVGLIDGLIGPKTIEALQAFQSSQGLLADGFTTKALLLRLRR